MPTTDSPIGSPPDGLLPTGDLELFQEAACAAQAKIEQWIRSTLRQVAIQGIRQSLAVHHDKQQLVLSNESIVTIQSMCLSVANKWSDALREVGHRRVADMISTIADEELASLFASKSRRETTNRTSETLQAGFANSESTTAATVPVSTLDTTATGTTSTTHSRLRQLGRRNVLAADPPQPALTPAAACDIIKNMHDNDNNGSGGGRTDWPYSSKIITDAVEQVPNRMHSNTTIKAQVTLIPKSVWERQQREQQQQQQQQHPDGATMNQTDTTVVPSSFATAESTEWLLNRKRKSAGRERKPPPRPVVTTTTTTATTTAAGILTVLPPQVESRPASMHPGTSQIAFSEVRNGWTERERRELDACLHDNATGIVAAGSSAPCLVLGALCDVGRHHAARQREIDQDDTSMFAIKKQRRLQRQAVKERLGDHCEETTDYDAGRRQRVSRIMRTVDAAQKPCLDLDVNNAWFDWVDPVTDERRFYAFESLEVIVLDQDEQQDEGTTDAETTLL